MIELGFFTALGVILVFSHGMADDAHVPALVALMLGVTATLFVDDRRASFRALSPGAKNGVLAVTLVVFTLFLAHGSELFYARKDATFEHFTDLLHWLPVAAAVAFAATRVPDRALAILVGWAALLATLWMLVETRVLVLTISPSPHIDVWTSSQRAVDYFLDGKNPYTQSYADIYNGKYDYFPSFPYLPAYLYWATLGVFLFKKAHDVRVSLLAAELITAAFIGGIARQQKLPPLTAMLLVVTWLSFPVDLFILEQAWIDELLLVAFAGAVWALASRRFVVAGIFLGVACATKQYAVLGVSFFAVYAWRNGGLRGLVRLGLATGLVAAAFMLPFALANFAQFTKYTLMSWGGALPRPDSLSFAAYWAHKQAPVGDDELRAVYKPFALVSGVVWLGLLGWLASRKRPTMRELLIATGSATGLLLLVAKQAFCNYYYFMSFFIFAAMMFRAGRESGTAEES